MIHVILGRELGKVGSLPHGREGEMLYQNTEMTLVQMGMEIGIRMEKTMNGVGKLSEY